MHHMMGVAASHALPLHAHPTVEGVWLSGAPMHWLVVAGPSPRIGSWPYLTSGPVPTSWKAAVAACLTHACTSRSYRHSRTSIADDQHVFPGKTCRPASGTGCWPATSTSPVKSRRSSL